MSSIIIIIIIDKVINNLKTRHSLKMKSIGNNDACVVWKRMKICQHNKNNNNLALQILLGIKIKYTDFGCVGNISYSCNSNDFLFRLNCSIQNNWVKGYEFYEFTIQCLFTLKIQLVWIKTLFSSLNPI